MNQVSINRVSELLSEYHAAKKAQAAARAEIIAILKAEGVTAFSSDSGRVSFTAEHTRPAFDWKAFKKNAPATFNKYAARYESAAAVAESWRISA